MSLLEMGGYTFTIPLTLLAVGGFLTAVRTAMLIHGGETQKVQRPLSLVLHLGIFSFILGVLGQTIGLFEAMTAIETAAHISPAMLAGGLRVSFITTIYGLLILTVSFLVWMILRAWAAKAA